MPSPTNYMLPPTHYIFFGTPEFAAIILKKLINSGMAPETVVCNPDRPAGRKKIITPPPVKLVAQKYNIRVWQPEVLNRNAWDLPIARRLGRRGELVRYPPVGGADWDFFIVAAYAKILPKEILAIPRLGTIGVHPSLLPKYRGPTPIQTAILNGETETGTTLFLLDEAIDHGPILAQEHIPIHDRDTYEIMEQKLAQLSGELLAEIIPKFLRGMITPQPQDHVNATYTKKFSSADGFVNLEKDNPELILRKIRALNPEPGVWSVYPPTGDGKRVKLLAAELTGGKLILQKIQAEGKKPVEL